MTIKIGDQLPAHDFIINTDDGPAKMSTAELCGGKKVVLIGLPGAFTPTCHVNHLPGYIENRDALSEKGIDEVAVTSVNDMHVMKAWAKATNGEGKVHYLSDGNADFAKAIGMDIDLGVAGMGVRSKRYSMIIEDGKVTAINTEDNPGVADVSSVAALLGQL